MQTQQNKSKGKSRRKGLDEGAREMVSREVHYCVSSLIYDMYSKDEYADELMDVMRGKPDYEEAAMQNGWLRLESGEWTRACNEGSDEPPYFDTAKDACESEGIEPYEREIYEHWIVSDWLADRLEEKGHAVLRDFYGLTIWARPTPGQAIYMDSVIQEIYTEMMSA